MKLKKKYASLIGFWALLLLFGCASAKNNNFKHKHNINKYMSDVFGNDYPTLEHFVKYQGRHGEEEYELELELCREKWGNANQDIKKYAKNLPKECADWISNRNKNPGTTASLFYQSIREKIKDFPVQYQIMSIEEAQMGDIVKIKILDSKCDSLSLLYTSEKYRDLGYIVLQNVCDSLTENANSAK